MTKKTGGASRVSTVKSRPLTPVAVVAAKAKSLCVGGGVPMSKAPLLSPKLIRSQLLGLHTAKLAGNAPSE
jgi:hypothetical protein